MEDKPSITPAIALTLLGACLGIISTLLVSTMDQVNQKADKSAAGDRWTGRMQQIKQQCDREKEILRKERETLRDEALRWESASKTCESSLRIRRELREHTHKTLMEMKK